MQVTHTPDDERRASHSPLPLPARFNPETHMLAKNTEYGTFHETRAAAHLARRLVQNGHPDDLQLAESVLNAVLDCQERDARDPHHGNFTWMREDTVVEDLNAGSFVLRQLIPMMVCFEDRLSTDLQSRVRESIRHGLEAIMRLDVLVAYTNITAMHMLNLAVGGELLGDRHLAARGYRRMVDWIRFTNQSGSVFEYNSPTYASVTLECLRQLAEFTQDEATKVRARAMAARIGLSAALHVHPVLGRWAGPHSRVYQPTVIGETPPEVERLRRLLRDDALPSWIESLLTARTHLPFQVAETASQSMQHGFTTYLGPSFALGVASRNFGPQANPFVLNWMSKNGTGVLYTRYVQNDKWLGDFHHDTDRSNSRNFLDEGDFFGVHDGPRAIGVYAPKSPGALSSAKTALIFSGEVQVDEVWIASKRVKDLPAEVPSGDVVVIGSGDVWIAVKPLTRTALGREAPIRLERKGADLVLELYNYRGAQKRFWELNWPGPFYKGRPFCSFYIEVALRTEYEDAEAFAQAIESGGFRERLDPAFTYPAEGERLYAAEYSRNGSSLGLEIELMEWRLGRRWTHEGDWSWPMLDSPLAKQSRSGFIRVGDATLACGQESAWLLADPSGERWVAGFLGLKAAPLKLVTPRGGVEIASMGTGTVVWENGRVTVDGLDVQGVRSWGPT